MTDDDEIFEKNKPKSQTWNVKDVSMKCIADARQDEREKKGCDEHCQEHFEKGKTAGQSTKCACLRGDTSATKCMCYEAGKRTGFGDVKCRRCGWHAHCECITRLEAKLKEYKFAENFPKMICDRNAKIALLETADTLNEKMLNKMSQKVSDLLNRERLLEKELAELKDILCQYDTKCKCKLCKIAEKEIAKRVRK